MATFALVTTVGSQPRPARSTPGEPGRAANRQAFASLSYPTDRQVVRNPHVGRPGFLMSTGLHPRTAVRRGRHAGLLLINVLPKTLRTIPTYIVYDIVTQCFGHEPWSGAMSFDVGLHPFQITQVELNSGAIALPAHGFEPRLARAPRPPPPAPPLRPSLAPLPPPAPQLRPSPAPPPRLELWFRRPARY